VFHISKKKKTTLKEKLDVDHVLLIVKKFEKKVNCNLKSPLERQLSKKRPSINASAIFNFLGAMDHYKKDNVQYKTFVEDLGLLVIKTICPFNLLKVFD
jgi:hypothetical protein